ncbi:MAG: hypothetical protein KatS3mg081_2325 [Gemmatimonadales bacterium]|nr:MAG: hypothetical protein KatS3mg081_2325 [Gemmatimonadales bacterium]
MIGGGLAGLTAAREIARRGFRVILLESSPRLGGQIFTQHHQDFLLEHGAEGYSAASRVMARLVAELGLTDRTVKQAVKKAYLLSGSKLEPLAGRRAASLVGIQTSGRSQGSGLVSMAAGMKELVDRLAREVRAQGEIRTGAAVAGLEPVSGKLRLRLTDGASLLVNRSIAAVPPQALATMLPDELRGEVQDLCAMPAFSSVSVSLAYPRDQVAHPLDAAGMVPAAGPRSGPGFKACVFSSSKFPGRSPRGWVLLRVFFRPGGEYPFGAPDPWWVERAEEVVSEPLGIRARAWLSWVARWEGVLPLWDERRVRAVRRLRRIVAENLPLELAGSHYLRSGIPGAVRSGIEAARRVAPRPGIA